jgi:hypothetical protein
LGILRASGQSAELPGAWPIHWRCGGLWALRWTSNLLDIIRTFTLFSTDDKGQMIKIVGRYQQFAP